MSYNSNEIKERAVLIASNVLHGLLRLRFILSLHGPKNDESQGAAFIDWSSCSSVKFSSKSIKKSGNFSYLFRQSARST